MNSFYTKSIILLFILVPSIIFLFLLINKNTNDIKNIKDISYINPTITVEKELSLTKNSENYIGDQLNQKINELIDVEIDKRQDIAEFNCINIKNVSDNIHKYWEMYKKNYEVSENGIIDFNKPINFNKLVNFDSNSHFNLFEGMIVPIMFLQSKSIFNKFKILINIKKLKKKNFYFCDGTDITIDGITRTTPKLNDNNIIFGTKVTKKKNPNTNTTDIFYPGENGREELLNLSHIPDHKHAHSHYYYKYEHVTKEGATLNHPADVDYHPPNDDRFKYVLMPHVKRGCDDDKSTESKYNQYYTTFHDKEDISLSSLGYDRKTIPIKTNLTPKNLNFKNMQFYFIYWPTPWT